MAPWARATTESEGTHSYGASSSADASGTLSRGAPPRAAEEHEDQHEQDGTRGYECGTSGGVGGVGVGVGSPPLVGLLDLPEELLLAVLGHTLSPFAPRSALALSTCCQPLLRMLTLHEDLAGATRELVRLRASATSLAFKMDTTLVEMASPDSLVLRWNWRDLNPADMGVLAELCRHMPRLREIDLLGNQIGDGGAGAIAAASAQGCLPSLHSLHMGANAISGKGAAALASAASSQPPAFWRLKQLCLNHNLIHQEAMLDLALALGGGAMPLLRTLYLEGNPADDVSD